MSSATRDLGNGETLTTALEAQALLQGPVEGDDGSGVSIVVSPPIHGVWGDAGYPDAVGVFGSSKFGNGVWGTTADPASVVVSGVAGVLGTGQVGVQGVSDVGSGVLGQSSSGDGIVGATASSALDAAGVRGVGRVGVAGGVLGSNTVPVAAVGVYGSGSNGRELNGMGVFGETDTGIGVRGLASGFGTGVQGESANHVGVRGIALTGAGVQGLSQDGVGVGGGSTSGIGVHGHTISGVGVVGDGAISAVGVSGKSQSNVGVSGRSQTGIAVEAISEFRTAVRAIGGTVGIFAQGPSLAGSFSGDVFVSGYLSKGGGGFSIDHPLYPEEQFLNHSFVESSEMKNVYDGVVVLDARGEAAVQMPDWFEAVNSDYRYLLTAIGGPSPGLYIASELSQGSFQIAGGTPGLKVSWQLTGIRRDVWARQHRRPVEQAKSPAERGLLLHPAEAGKPHLLSIHEKSGKHEADGQRRE